LVIARTGDFGQVTQGDHPRSGHRLSPVQPVRWFSFIRTVTVGPGLSPGLLTLHGHRYMSG
jgi:hypothetical protein